jgi:hypothetical protein
MGTRTAALPISTYAPIPPDQILRCNPAVPITIAALVIAVVDSTIIVEDFSRFGIVEAESSAQS